ncbi:hypothetical protein T492DRAFT_857124, partial [Pavlovales sp. CCMP2436]
ASFYKSYAAARRAHEGVIPDLVESDRRRIAVWVEPWRAHLDTGPSEPVAPAATATAATTADGTGAEHGGFGGDTPRARAMFRRMHQLRRGVQRREANIDEGASRLPKSLARALATAQMHSLELYHAHPRTPALPPAADPPPSATSLFPAPRVPMMAPLPTPAETMWRGEAHVPSVDATMPGPPAKPPPAMSTPAGRARPASAAPPHRQMSSASFSRLRARGGVPADATGARVDWTKNQPRKQPLVQAIASAHPGSDSSPPRFAQTSELRAAILRSSERLLRALEPSPAQLAWTAVVVATEVERQGESGIVERLRQRLENLGDEAEMKKSPSLRAFRVPADAEAPPISLGWASLEKPWARTHVPPARTCAPVDANSRTISTGSQISLSREACNRPEAAGVSPIEHIEHLEFEYLEKRWIDLACASSPLRAHRRARTPRESVPRGRV